jgi:heptosyltransferase-2
VNRIGFDKGGGAFFHSKRLKYSTGIHEVDRNLELAREAGWKWEGFKPRIFPDKDDCGKVDGFVDKIEKYCVLAPGSVWPTKKWPAQSYIEAGRIFLENGYTPVLSGGKDDKNLCMAIAEKLPGTIDTSGLLTLRQSAELYRRAEFVLTGDTAPQHIAAAMGTWVFSLFGPTVRDFGFWPYSEKGIVIEEKLSCRPCGIHGHKTCRKRTHDCLRSLSGIRVASIVLKELGSR